MRIILETIPHEQQRYSCLIGDYWVDENGDWHIAVSEMENPDHSFLITVHELIEIYATQRKGIPEPEIMAFDLKFEKERKEGKHTADDEPGDDHRSPYYREHQYASAIEYLMAVALDVDRNDYDNAVLELLNPT
jgi:hypothetical protein